jgi:hypothetical protein
VNVTVGDYTVTNNKFHDAQNNDCVSIATPDTLTLTGNKAQSCYGSAYNLDVDLNPIVNSNNGTDASGLNTAPSPTMLVQCETDCSGAQVNTNTLDGGGNEQRGLLFIDNSGSQGATISGNTITNMQGTGLEVGGNGGATVMNNTVVNSSDVDNLFGIYLNSDSNTLTGSNVYGGFDNGIEIAGAFNAANSNQSHDNGEDGIHVASGVLNSLNLNRTLNNAGEGTEDDAPFTTITNNTSSGNRQDCAGTDPFGTYGPGNTCADGTSFTDPGVITAPIRKHHT